jgi:4-amino-4-deoxy-L-arabinose transferase-like glycosyltransferase
MAATAALLGWLVGHTDVLFADGLRYIEQARRLERGDWSGGVRRAVDHPLYPLAVAGAHRALRLGDGPGGWQAAAQGASALAGVLLAVPLYLVARELFGGSAGWLACLLWILAPVPARVSADALSESTFLLCWTWGVWAALRYCQRGSAGWLAPTLGLGALAYLARPEGLLLPAALAAVLAATPLLPAARLDRRRWWAAAALLVLGPAVLVGPYVAAKGGIGTKPAVARLLGLAPPSGPDAVERAEPLVPGRSGLATAGSAARAAGMAVARAVTNPLLPFAAVGVAAALWRRWAVAARAWVFLGVVAAAALLALARLYATGGYCTPRHALIVALPLFAAAASGLRVAAAGLARALRRKGVVRAPSAVRFALTRALPAFAGLALMAPGLPALVAPLNAESGGYREAGRWLARHAAPGERVADVTGWAQFYSERSGYSFANLVEAPADPALRWVVVRDAHLAGPWGYCDRLRALVAGARVAARFPPERLPGRSRVTVYERPVAEVTASRNGGAVALPRRH